MHSAQSTLKAYSAPDYFLKNKCFMKLNLEEVLANHSYST